MQGKSYPIDHEEKDAVVCNCSHSNVKSCDNSKFALRLDVIDERIARSVKQVAADAILREGQLVPEGRENSV